MSTSALLSRGFIEVRPGVLVRLTCKDDQCRGLAIWKDGDATFYGGARVPLDKMRALVARLAATIGQHPDEVRRQKAHKTLSALLLSDLSQGTVEGQALEDDLDIVIAGVCEEVGSRASRRARRARRRARRHARRGRRRARATRRRARFKRSLNRLAKRVAKNKVLQKLRRGYAKVIEGPVGRFTAKLVGRVLSAYGVPAKATELAIRAHHARTASRLKDGGWAGVVERGTKKGGSLRSAMREEGKRFAKSWGQGAKDILPGAGIRSLKNLRRR